MCPASSEDGGFPGMSPFTDVEEEEGYEPVVNEVETHDDDIDDGQGVYLTPDAADDLYLRDAHGDSDGDGAAGEASTRVWKVDPSFGQYHFQWHQLLSKTNEEDFDGLKALELLQTPYTLDYGHTGSSGSAPTTDDDAFYPSFYLDYLSVVGRPLRPISRLNNRFFDNVTITFRHWQSPYDAKHSTELPFELENRTFRLATGAARELWFIVMHPRLATTSDARKKDAPRGRSALAKHHAEALLSHIKDVFLAGSLLGEGIEPSWGLTGELKQTITYNKWAEFQGLFMQRWPSFVARYLYDPFWTENQPAFHAYDYGANIEIAITDQLHALQPETHIRPGHGDAEEDRSTESQEERTIDSQRLPASLPSIARTPSASPHGRSVTDRPSPGRDGSSAADESLDDAMYSQGLLQLRTELQQKYNLDGIDMMSYALAVNINCIAGKSARSGAGQSVCLLADRNQLGREYSTQRDYTFFPLGFHPAYGNFSSSSPPDFLAKNQLAITRDNMSYENEGADVVSFGFFQAYSNVKRSIRHRPSDLLATQGAATAAFTIPAEEMRSVRLRTKQKRLFDRISGKLTPDNPESSTPFAREKTRLQAAIDEQEFAFRFEQVVNIRVQRLVRARRSFGTVIRPIFQLMRFFLQEKQYYSSVLRKFPPQVFPGILVGFSTVFETAVEEMRQRFLDEGATGLGLALSEGIAAIDRLGNFCFTGDPRVLPCRVFRPLETMESLRRAGWPYLDPGLLDLRQGRGKIHLGRWPKTADGRPVLMHVASLAYHYGHEVAANRHSQLWFGELGGRSIQGIATAARFLEEVFRELWISETRAFVVYQLRRRLHRGERGGVESPDAVAGGLLCAWEAGENPFRKARLHELTSNSLLPGVHHERCTRRDFATELYHALASKDAGQAVAFAPVHSSWFAILRAAIQHTGTDAVSKDRWVEGIEMAMQSAGIDWVPGRHRQRLTHTKAVALVGLTPARNVLAARPGSLKRAALEATEQMLLGPPQKRARRQKIDFGCDVPFREIPRLVSEGFAKLGRIFAKGNTSVLDHYEQAKICLHKSLGNPLCDLMLMMVLTVGASSVTPQVAPGERVFSGAARRKDPALLAANMVTRMLWFLMPDAFPWHTDDGSILRIPEMTKKIEHKGVSNRVLRELGWVQTSSERDSPRNSECDLAPTHDLLRLYSELLALRQEDPHGYVARIFDSDDRIWTERCSSLFRDA